MRGACGSRASLTGRLWHNRLREFPNCLFELKRQSCTRAACITGCSFQRQRAQTFNELLTRSYEWHQFGLALIGRIQHGLLIPQDVIP